MEITLLRHAPTAENLASNYVGRTDPPLAEAGRALARSVGADHTVPRVHTSALRRAVETAALLFPKADILTHPGLDEMDFGAFENQNWRSLEGNDAYAAWLAGGCEAACPGGEDRAGFAARCQTAFVDIVAAERTLRATRLVVVAHGGTIMAILHAFATPRRQFFDWKAGYCGGYLLRGETADGVIRLRLMREIP